MFSTPCNSIEWESPGQIGQETKIMRKVFCLTTVSVTVLAAQGLLAQVVDPNVVGPARRAAAALPTRQELLG